MHSCFDTFGMDVLKTIKLNAKRAHHFFPGKFCNFRTLLHSSSIADGFRSKPQQPAPQATSHFWCCPAAPAIIVEALVAARSTCPDWNDLKQMEHRKFYMHPPILLSTPTFLYEQ